MLRHETGQAGALSTFGRAALHSGVRSRLGQAHGSIKRKRDKSALKFEVIKIQELSAFFTVQEGRCSS
jgi:hypothetical protein